jgi:hypothetical protein
MCEALSSNPIPPKKKEGREREKRREEKRKKGRKGVGESESLGTCLCMSLPGCLSFLATMR